MWVRGKIQKWIAWMLVTVLGILIPGLNVTTHICYARDTHEVWLIAKEHCCAKPSTNDFHNNPTHSCCAKKAIPQTCCSTINPSTCTVDAAQAYSLKTNKTKIDSGDKSCCKKEAKLFKIKDSFVKKPQIKTWVYLPLVFLIPQIFEIIPLDLVSLRYYAAHAPPLPYGKALCYWLQVLLN